MCTLCGNPEIQHDSGDAGAGDPVATDTSVSSVGESATIGLLGLTISVKVPNVLEVVDALASSLTTYSIGVGQSAQANIGLLGDHDWYRVDLVAGQTYSFAEIGTGTNSLQNTFLYLHNASGTVVASDNDSGPASSSSFTYTPTVSGTYYVDAAANANSATGQYGISVTLGTRPDFDIPMGGGAIDAYASWSAPGTPATITYGFRQSLPTYSVTGASAATVQLSTAEMAAIQQILQLWSDVAAVNFVQVNPGGYTNNATILFGNYQANDGAGAYAYYPGSSAASAAEGDVWLNLNSVSTSSVPVGSYSFFAIMHEMGHAIGLSHPGDYNAGVGQTITYANNAQFVQDSEQYSVMSYFGGTNTGETPGGFATAYTPMMLDIYELQQIYGANTTTRVGNTTYGFNNTAGSIYSFSAGSLSQYCIWDAGGTDILDCSGYSQNQLINLNAGTFSNVGGGTGNISIAIGATIESAIGGSGADTLIANGSGSTLDGKAGNDSLTCGAGVDTIVFRTGSGADTVVGFTAGSGGDKIDLTAMTNIHGFNDIVASTAGADTLINFGGGNSLTLQGVVPGNLSAANFIFAGSGSTSGPGSVAISDVTITEDNSGTKVATFTVTRTGGTDAFAVNYATAAGTASGAAGDYVATSGTVNFGIGVTSQTVSVTINGDTTVEPDETFFVNLSGATNGATIVDSQGQGTIVNDDGLAGQPDLVVSSITAPQTVVQGGALNFSYVVQNNGNAAAGAHNSGYTIDQQPNQSNAVPLGSVSSLGAGSSGTLNNSISTTGLSVGQHTLYIMDDYSQAVAESNETNNVRSVTFNVTAPLSSVSINDVSIQEGNSGTKLATFTVTRTGGTDAFAVNYATAAGTASGAAGDYVATSGTVNFGIGNTTQTVSITINGDTTIESNETFFLNLTNATNGTTINDSQGLGTIVNDDGPGSVAISDVSITEGNSGTKVATFTVTRTGGTSAFNVSYATANGTATTADNDYSSASGTLSFGTGVTSKTVSVTIRGDTKIEANQTFFVNLSNATNGATISDSQGVGTIVNDDGTSISSSQSLSGTADGLSSAGASPSSAFFHRSETGPGWDFFEHNRTDWTQIELHDHPDPDHGWVADVLAALPRLDDALHQFQDALTHPDPIPATPAQWVERIEHIFHFDLH